MVIRGSLCTVFWNPFIEELYLFEFNNIAQVTFIKLPYLVTKFKFYDLLQNYLKVLIVLLALVLDIVNG